MNSLDLSRSALLLIDFQKDFLHPQGALQRLELYRVTDEERNRLVENARRLLQSMKSAAKPVVWVKTALRADHADSALPWNIRQHKNLRPESKFLVEGSWGCEFLDDLKPAEADIVMVKRGSSAFQFTYLDHLLSNLGVNTCVAI